MRKVALALAIVVVVTAAVAVYRQASKLYINGELASSNLIQHDGVAYVPVKDVAAALHLAARQTT